ncbi:uncharacterized protein LOC104583318 [Brachypodium distachyon]|uniref:NAC domain-containing protein n=1 Tax=Brachypodium distachyon TaxID=15368 RepID=I1HQI8_BRADI|nr:uncharacterized protein LOC104583318 [Brachypodium distachyon]KQK09254.1 hypothetical protein BRADI_2g46980v3 [Brachypodium distachyon]|eukprot:XP_010233490.1 uncharacterized protein LOC104583318 [Brachypodium distachyon]
MEEAEAELGEVFYLCSFNPSPVEAVTYFLPRLISGEPLPRGAEHLIHRVDIYNHEPKDLAAAFAPAPKAERTGDRFFFTLSKRQKGSRTRTARVAGAGTWTIQKTRDVNDESGLKVGERRSLCFRKGKASTSWVMEEYRCLRPDAIVDDGEMVFCKIHLSSKPRPEAQQESAAYLRRHQELAKNQPPMPVAKRPAPCAADPPSPKRARVASLTPAVAESDGGDSNAFASLLEEDMLGAVSSQDEIAPINIDDYIDRFTCSIHEFLGGATDPEEAATLPADEPENDFDNSMASDEEFNFDIPLLSNSSMVFNLNGEDSFNLLDNDLYDYKLQTDDGEQQQAGLTSDDESWAMTAEDEGFMRLMGSYTPWPTMFTLDQLEGHNEFFSYVE